MKTILSKSLLCVGLMTFAGCAEMKNMPIGSTVAGFVPGGAKYGSMIDSSVSVASDISDAQKTMSDPEEIEIGENVMAGILGAAPLYDNDRIQRYVNSVGRWVALQSERPTLPWRFAVLDSKLPNAGAAPGGQIYITTGLLFRMRNEAELAGALAHEVAHVVQRHHIKAYQKQKYSSAVATGVGAIADAKGGTSLGAQAGKAIFKLGIGEVRKMILLSLDRGEEEQADRMGAVLAARAGYDPFGLANVLQLLQDLQKDEGSASVLYSTHPAAGDRIIALDASMGKEMEKYSRQATLQDRFVTAMLGPGAPVPHKAPAAAPAKPPAKAPPKPKTAS